MITFDPRRPLPPMTRQTRIERIKQVTQTDKDDEGSKQERRRNDRRASPFIHRGPFEMRSGGDRRLDLHIEEEV